jgi:hypothetical protein
MFVLWILAGLAVLLGGCWLLNWSTDIYSDVLGLFMGIISVIVVCVGLCLPFVPLFVAEDNAEHRLMEACEDIGGEYRVIKEEYDGSQYVDVYGCVQGD